MFFIILFISLLFFAMGFVLNERNAEYLLSGYNTMSAEQRSQFELKPFLLFFRKFHFFLGVSTLLIGSGLYFVNTNAAGVFVTCYPLLAYLYFSVKTKKYSANIQTRWKNLGVYIMSGTLVFVGVLLYYGFRNDRLIVEKDVIKIEGIYSEEMRADEIKSISIEDTIPAFRWKVNGFALGTICKGYFKTKQGERIKVNLNPKKAPYLLVVKNDGKKFYYAGESLEDKVLLGKIRSFQAFGK